jgi:hypothetical protein
MEESVTAPFFYVCRAGLAAREHFAASVNTCRFLSNSTLPSILYECTVLCVKSRRVQVYRASMGAERRGMVNLAPSGCENFQMRGQARIDERRFF